MKTQYSYGDIVERLLSPTWLAESAEGEKTAMFSSYDRRSHYDATTDSYIDWDANADGQNYLGETEDGGKILAEMTGPGYISRIWTADAQAGHVKIYIDGKVAFDAPFCDYFGGENALFPYPSLSYIASSGKNCYVPITYNESCKIVAYGSWGQYYEIGYTALREGCTVESLTGELTDTQKEALANVDAIFSMGFGINPSGESDAAFEPLAVTENTPAVKNLTGKGQISGLLIRVAGTGVPQANTTVELLKKLHIRIYWDGESTPSVDAPLGDFFGSSYGVVALRSLLLGVREDGTFYNYYAMPYTNGARIEISGADAEIELSVNTEEFSLANSRAMRYCVQFTRGAYTEAQDRQPDFGFLQLSGKGRLVGLTLHIYQNTDGAEPGSEPGEYWWGEGDDKFFVDGEKMPSWYGTGTEDFFGYAWADVTPFSRAFHSQSYVSGGIHNAGNRVLTRSLVTDSVPFESSFDGYFEKYYRTYTAYGFTSHYYLAPDATAVREDDSAEDYYSYFGLDPVSVPSAFLEGENLSVLSHTGGVYWAQDMAWFGDKWSGTTQIVWKNDKENGEMSFALPSVGSGRYVLLASFTTANDFGKYTFSVNGTDLGITADFYTGSVDARLMTDLGTVELTAGFDNVLTAKCVGKNPYSIGYLLGIDFLILVPEEEYHGLRNFDLSQYTDVVRANVGTSRKEN